MSEDKVMAWHETENGPYTSKQWDDVVLVIWPKNGEQMSVFDTMRTLVERFGIAPAPEDGPCVCGHHHRIPVRTWEGYDGSKVECRGIPDRCRVEGCECLHLNPATLDVLYARQGEELKTAQSALDAAGVPSDGSLTERVRRAATGFEVSDKTHQMVIERMAARHAEEIAGLKQKYRGSEIHVEQLREVAKERTRERDEARVAESHFRDLSATLQSDVERLTRERDEAKSELVNSYNRAHLLDRERDDCKIKADAAQREIGVWMDSARNWKEQAAHRATEFDGARKEIDLAREILQVADGFPLVDAARKMREERDSAREELAKEKSRNEWQAVEIRRLKKAEKEAAPDPRDAVLREVARMATSLCGKCGGTEAVEILQNRSNTMELRRCSWCSPLHDALASWPHFPDAVKHKP